MKKLIAFDLDGTLTDSKSPMEDRMSELFDLLLKKMHVCVISGGQFNQFEKQLLSSIKSEPEQLGRLHLMPTCGTRYLKFIDNNWKQIYAEDLKQSEKEAITTALNKGFDDLGYREKKVWGETVEDRGSQITFSVLGQDIVSELGIKGLRMKEQWDPGDRKKLALRDYIAPLIPQFEVRVGGITSIDVTRLGIDKAYGMKKLMEELKLKKKDILFIGDRIREGGNDYPVKLMGVDCMEISHWQETALVVEAILKTV